MITKETFCSLLNALESSKDRTDSLCDEICELVKKHRNYQDIDVRGYQLWPFVSDVFLEDRLVELLEIEMEDTESSWISYYVYELEFGKADYSSNSVVNPDGTTTSLSTAEELYDFLVSNIKEKRSKEIFGNPVYISDSQDESKSKTYKVNTTWTLDNCRVSEIECLDYDGLDDKVSLQLFTGMYFAECGNCVKGRSANGDLTVKKGDTVIKVDNSFYAVPRSVINSIRGV